MKKFLLSLSIILFASFNLFAEVDYLCTDGTVIPLYDIYSNATTSSPGEFQKWSISLDTPFYRVKGPINGSDLAALWRASLYGALTEIDLSEAEIVDGIIPDFAFWNETEQLDPSCEHYKYIRLKKIILPQNTKEIGQYAFANAINLEEVVFPDGLMKIDESAFYNCNLKNVVLPSTCINFDGTSQFRHNKNLKKFYMAEGTVTIPPSFVEECCFLEEFVMPSTVRYINDRAFLKCRKLKLLDLSSSLEIIGDLAFWGMDKLEELSFPISLKSIGRKSCEYLTSLQTIYCAAPEPPICQKIDSDEKSLYKPFGTNINYHKNTYQGANIHIPVGSAQKYRKAWGWDYFFLFYETDEFPNASVDNVNMDDSHNIDAIYDLSGRCISNPQNGTLYIHNGKKFIYH